MGLFDVAKSRYQRHRNRVNYNKELLIAELFGFPGTAASAQLTSLVTNDPILISIGAGAGEYLSYLTGYAASSFWDNKSYYWDSGRKRIRGQFATDMKKFVAGATVADGIYYAAITTLNYYFVKNGMKPYEASIASQGISTLLYLVLMNVVGHVSNIADKDKNNRNIRNSKKL